MNEIQKIEDDIKNLDYKIKKIQVKEEEFIKIGIWNEELTKKILQYETCVDYQIERVVDTKGDFEYFMQIHKSVLIDLLGQQLIQKEQDRCDVETKIRQFIAEQE